MRLSLPARVCLITFLISIISFTAWADSEPISRFRSGEGTFMLDGKPFVIKAAELHYPRIPRPYWKHRIDMCKALGMNTVCLYVFWNVHEPQPDNWDFTGQNDLREFIKLCQEAGLYVILRPGPYVCAEWEMGGLPWWLLNKEDIRLRENDPYFLERVERFEKAVAAQVADMTIDNGGPILMIQVENEYGSYGTDKEYVSAIRNILRRHFGPQVTLFQCDWSSNFHKNGLDDLLWTLNFGTGADIEKQFAPLRAVRPDSPLMCSEFWSGWFDKWGARHETRSADAMIKGIDNMLSRGISFSLYMTHGGTNWGHWAGANSPGYAPDVTSYDYDAPISESGVATPKYAALRELLSRYSSEPLPEVPAAYPTTEIPTFELTEMAPLWDNLPSPQADSTLRTMEHYGQGFGSILYRTTLPEIDVPVSLMVTEPHDYAQVFIDGVLVAVLDRRRKQFEAVIPPCRDGAQLDILVEATGRINFGRAIKDYKGITSAVTLTRRQGRHDWTCSLDDWQTYLIPDGLDTYNAMNFRPVSADSIHPVGVYRGHFNVSRPADTFLDFSTWGKGLVYVNGHPMGRIWGIGPQQTLYMPGCWLREGENEIIVFDVIGPEKPEVSGLRAPVLDHRRTLPSRIGTPTGPAVAADGVGRLSAFYRVPTVGVKDIQKSISASKDSFKVAHTGSLSRDNSWQHITFDTPVTGRYLCLEILSNHAPGPVSAIAELYITGTDGKRLSREDWSILSVDSEDIDGGNHTADKLYDLQESTYWQSSPGAPLPHRMVIDLGGVTTFAGLDLLSRMEPTFPAAVESYRVSLR